MPLYFAQSEKGVLYRGGLEGGQSSLVVFFGFPNFSFVYNSAFEKVSKMNF